MNNLSCLGRGARVDFMSRNICSTLHKFLYFRATSSVVGIVFVLSTHFPFYSVSSDM